MDAGHPKLLQAEASAGMNLRVVPDHQASHHRPERTGCGAWGNAAHLGLLGLASTDLASRLVEPRGHALLSVLVEVRPQDRAIPAGLHGCGRKASSEGSRRGKLLSYIIIFQYLRYSGDTFFFFFLMEAISFLF